MKAGAYRAKPLRGRRAARAAGFRRPRRFGPNSLSIIPHPALMGTSRQGGPTCSAQLGNATESELIGAYPADFQMVGTVTKAPPPVIDPGTSSGTWEVVGSVGGRCLNSGKYTMPAIGTVTFSIDSADGYTPSCDAPEGYTCSVQSQSGGDVFWGLDEAPLG